MTRRAPILSEQKSDIQGLMNSGYGWLTRSRFWLLTIRDGREDHARAWLQQRLASGLVVSAEDAVDRTKRDRIGEAIAIAFSYAGLIKLGLQETATHPFPSPFRSGMGSALRQKLLKDDDRTNWRWSDAEGIQGRRVVHVLIAQWWREAGGGPQMPQPDPEAFCFTTVDDRPTSFDEHGRLYEPFGFRDGIAQPIIRGLREDTGETITRVRREAGVTYNDRVIAPGEFILGYRNEYNELTYCPDVEHWTASGRANYAGGHFALNGSYLAVRQIEQNVDAFNALEQVHGSSVCEKLMGRKKNGLPLSWKGDPKADVSSFTADAFRYRVDDADGLMCPKGAHIRRVNPRDSLGADLDSSIKSSKLHRLLRRGRPFRECKDGKEHVGLFFIACNADFERQFEFIHQRWVRNVGFGNLHREDDPIVGAVQNNKTFTIPGLPSGDEISLQALTETLGGGYFFLPGLKALEFIVDSRSAAAGKPT